MAAHATTHTLSTAPRCENPRLRAKAFPVHAAPPNRAPLHLHTAIEQPNQRIRTVACAVDSSQESPQPTAADAYEAELTVWVEVPNTCILTVTLRPEGSEAAFIPALLAALYEYYISRAKKLTWAVVKLLETKPTLRAVMPDDLLGKLKSRPSASMKVLADFGSLLALCKVAAPDVAASVERGLATQHAALATTLAARRTASASAAVEGSRRVIEASAAFETGHELVKGPDWERWKEEMREGVLTWHHSITTTPRASGITAQREGEVAQTFKIIAQAAGGGDLQVAVTVEGRGPDLRAVATQGPNVSLAARALGQYLNLKEPRPPKEPHLPDYLAARCWDAAGTIPPTAFTCTFPRPGAAAVELQGTGGELATLMTALSVLESGELGVTGGGWIPRDGALAFQKRPVGGGGQAYRVRVRGKVPGNDEGETIQQVTGQQVWALIECLDAFSQINPGVVPATPLPPIEPVSWWRRVWRS